MAASRSDTMLLLLYVTNGFTPAASRAKSRPDAAATAVGRRLPCEVRPSLGR
jgi:hypothetical protein